MMVAAQMEVLETKYEPDSLLQTTRNKRLNRCTDISTEMHIILRKGCVCQLMS
jgi:hypothetical protein